MTTCTCEWEGPNVVNLCPAHAIAAEQMGLRAQPERPGERMRRQAMERRSAGGRVSSLLDLVEQGYNNAEAVQNAEWRERAEELLALARRSERRPGRPNPDRRDRRVGNGPARP